MVVPGLAVRGGAGPGEAVGVGAGLDDVAAERDAVDDGRAEAGVGEGSGPAAEGFVGGDGDACFFFSFGQDLEAEPGAAAVEFHVDDIGMLPAGQDAAEAFYRIADAAYEGVPSW
jgi:hypothetical protein